MSLLIENCKGRVHVFSSGGRQSSSFYKIEPALPTGKSSRSLILGIPIAMQEIVQPTVTLDDKRALYIFGSAWSELSLQGILLLGESSDKGALLGELMAWYETNRVSKSKKPAKLSLGSGTIDAYVTGLRLDAANAEINTQNFTIILLTPGTN